VTDTAALTHVKQHITDLYDEAIRHGVAILDARKGVEAAESLRIRQSTQSASIYSVYLAAMNAIKEGLIAMCKWGEYNEEDIILDAPSSLTQGIPDSSVLKEIIEGFSTEVIPLPVIHRYLVYSGLLDQTVGFEDYIEQLNAYKPTVKTDNNGAVADVSDTVEEDSLDKDGNIIKTKSIKKQTTSAEIKKESEGPEDTN